MGNKHVITIRFHVEGIEEELYRRIQEGKEKAGLSAPDYVKKILSEYFADEEKRSEAERVLQEIREEYRDMIERVERTIRHSIQEHDAILIGALSKISGTAAVSESISKGDQGNARLPERGGDIPEEALDFLNNL